jgi:hypothetical protein
MKTFDAYLEALEDAITDLQAQLDEAELFGGDTCILKDSIAEFCRERDAERSRKTITLERGNTITPTPCGAWGRIHFMFYAMGPQRADGENWVCTSCRTPIREGESHYKRSYYADKADNHSGRQARICEACKETHEANFPTMTTFSVFRPARQKVA